MNIHNFCFLLIATLLSTKTSLLILCVLVLFMMSRYSEEMKVSHSSQLEEIQRRHSSELRELRERMEVERQAWEENILKKQDTAMLTREREMREQLRLERDKVQSLATVAHKMNNFA